jgi:hypothetical protein
MPDSPVVKIRPLLYGAVALGVLAVPTAALAHSHTLRLPTDATFGGTVNGTTTHATIRMACFGPDRPGRTGHPMSGQTVGVFIPEVAMSATFGHTGDPARAIGVSLVVRGRHVGPFTWLRRLTPTRPVVSATGALPTSLTLPCSGTGTAVFTPVPGTAGVKSATVDVRFVGQP